jgi:diguanylate cyclase (GGDEF)-like protein
MSLGIVARIYGHVAEQAERNWSIARRLARSEAELRRLNTDLKSESLRLSCCNEQLKHRATIDGLTGLANRRHLDRVLAGAVQDARRAGSPLSVLLLDVDHFKQFNDIFGHAAGDQVLRTVAELLRSTVRDGDLVGRYGGDELLAVLPGADADQAASIAERLRQSVAGRLRVCDRAVTLSLGVATLGQGAEDAEALVAAADRALYRAKHLGRDHVCLGTSDLTALPGRFLGPPPWPSPRGDSQAGLASNIS